MKFNFPKDKKTESVTISIYEKDIRKIRYLAELNKCTQQDIYKTLISEAIEEYEEKFGVLNEKQETHKYSVKRDYVEAGDNKRKDIKSEFTDEQIVKGVRELEAKAGMQTDFSYCANPNCKKPYGGKFVTGTGTERMDFQFCSINCADEIRPIRQPLPLNTEGEIYSKHV